MFNTSLQYIPVFIATIIFQSSCFWISILGFLVHSEKMYTVEIIGMLICFTCVALIATGDSQDESGPSVSEAMFTFGLLMSIATSWVYSSNAILNRALKDFNYIIIMTYHGLMGLSLAVAIILILPFFKSDINSYWEGITFFNYSAEIYWRMIFAVSFDVVAVNSMTIAYQSDSSGFVSLISYIAVFYAFLGDLLIFKETFTPRELICSILTLSVIVGVSVYKLIVKQE